MTLDLDLEHGHDSRSSLSSDLDLDLQSEAYIVEVYLKDCVLNKSINNSFTMYMYAQTKVLRCQKVQVWKTRLRSHAVVLEFIEIYGWRTKG